MPLRVLKKEGEATVFYVESDTLLCTDPLCGKMWNRKLRPDLFIGAPCPCCLGKKVAEFRGTLLTPQEAAAEVPRLDCRFHNVDIAGYHYNGQCGCEWFQFKLEPELVRATAAEQGAGTRRCKHINAARSFALDVALHLHERERRKDARGQREDNQP